MQFYSFNFCSLNKSFFLKKVINDDFLGNFNDILILFLMFGTVTLSINDLVIGNCECFNKRKIFPLEISFSFKIS